MDWDDLEPRKPKKQLRPLDPLSLEELETYIVELTAEIERARGEIAKKKAVRAAAAGFFKS